MFIPVMVVAAMALAGAQNARDPLAAARELYASAAYEEALTALNRVGPSEVTAVKAGEVDQYRAFCLFALGRVAEAEAVAESIIRKDPTAEIDRTDASPRIDAMFTEVRKRLLPQIIRDEYRTTRALVSEKSPDAPTHLATVSRLLSEAEKIGAWDDTLADLRLLVDGFSDLQRAAVAAAAPPVSRSTATDSPARETTAPVSTVGGPTDATPTGTTGSRAQAATDVAVQPPVPIAESVPRVPAALMEFIKATHRSGTFDVVIDETGAVQDVIVRQSVLPTYDELFIQTARTWKYRPATRSGKPVGSVKTVVVEAARQ